MQTTIKVFLSLAFTGSLMACMPNGFLASPAKSGSASPSTADIAPTTQSNDRPTETGAGVPGYLVNCMDINATGELVQVGCSVATTDGARVKATADSWTRYDIKPAPGSNPSIVVTKLVAAGEEPWDVIFTFTGAASAELRAAAQSSTYSYTVTNEKGETIKVETLPPAQAPKPATTQNALTCTEGVLMDGVCIMTVSMSCTDYCAQSQMTVHPWVVDRFGTGASEGRQACGDLYDKFPDRSAFSIGLTPIVTGRGYGCYRTARGQPFFDSSPTDPSNAPFFGNTRICACQ
ncbi:MAG TPA: hypothetical protein VE954_35980 [Oligoflexus sp.]|uniref:hypothetical protein n=1 Tax=Oligoflexus sp. TaxID=1971216 RepID=UPI002D5FC71B|nr:hypothetical protein [Oligoflexus sp.]HYX38533.1 hypothetical protein [Oligoflexus sp.]